MKRIKTTLMVALAAAVLILSAGAAFAQQPGAGPGNSTFWYLQAIDERGQPITAALTCMVYQAGTDTNQSVFSDAALTTAVVQPVVGGAFGAGQAGICSWYTATSVASVDVIAWTKRARARVVALTAASSGGHRLVMDLQTSSKIIRVPIAPGPPSTGTSYRDTGVTIPKGFIVRDVFIEMTSAVAKAYHFVAGIKEADPAGFCSRSTSKIGTKAAGGVDISTTGWKRCDAQVTTAALAATLDFTYSAFHAGSLLARGAVGQNTGAVAHAGSYFRTAFIGDGVKKTLVYHIGAVSGQIRTADLASITGFFYVVGEEAGNDTQN